MSLIDQIRIEAAQIENTLPTLEKQRDDLAFRCEELKERLGVLQRFEQELSSTTSFADTTAPKKTKTLRGKRQPEKLEDIIKSLLVEHGAMPIAKLIPFAVNAGFATSSVSAALSKLKSAGIAQKNGEFWQLRSNQHFV